MTKCLKQFSVAVCTSTFGVLALVACAGEDGPSATTAMAGLHAEKSIASTVRPGAHKCFGPARPSPLPTSQRRNVILVIGDGRQLEDEIATSRYLYGRDYALVWDRFPYQGYVATWDATTYASHASSLGVAPYSADSYDPLVGYDPKQGGARPYPQENPDGLLDYLRPMPDGWWPSTDSAAAATAMSTGKKTDGGNVAWLPDDPEDGALLTIGEVLRARRGMSFGVVSTQAVSAATPAAFASHNRNRTNYVEIADEMVFSTKPDVVIGGGHPNWQGGTVSISSAALTALSGSDEYVFVERTAGVKAGPTLLARARVAAREGKKLFGLFGGARGSFDPAVAADTPGAPSLSPSDGGENPTLAEAAEAALTVLSRNPSGFFLMLEQGDIDSANHVNDYAQMISCGVDMERAVAKVVSFVDRPGDAIDWNNTVLVVVSDHATGYMRLSPKHRLGKGNLPTEDCTGSVCTYPNGEVSYETNGHTNELVHLSVMGEMAQILPTCEGREYPGTRIIDNTALHPFMLRAAGL